MDSIITSNHTYSSYPSSATPKGHLAFTIPPEGLFEPAPTSIITRYPGEHSDPTFLSDWIPTPLTLKTPEATDFTRRLQDCATRASYACFITLLESTLKAETVDLLGDMQIALGVGWEKSEVQEGMYRIANALQIIAHNGRRGSPDDLARHGLKVQTRLQQVTWECAANASTEDGMSDYRGESERGTHGAKSLVDKFVKIGNGRNGLSRKSPGRVVRSR